MNAVEAETEQPPASNGSESTAGKSEPGTEAHSSASSSAASVEPDAVVASGAMGVPDASSVAAGTMTITFKLYATLQDLLPRGSVKNAVQIEVATDATLYAIIDQYKVPRELAHLVLINGVFFCDADRDAKGILKPGDVLAIWPPVAGG